MMVQCVTYFGLIRRTPLVGVFRLVELDFYLDQMLFENSTTQIILIWYVELISWLWKDINGISMKQFLQFGQRLITVTGKFSTEGCLIRIKSWDEIFRCGNVAAILELDENLQRGFTIFEAAPQEVRGVPAKKPVPDYFL